MSIQAKRMIVGWIGLMLLGLTACVNLKQSSREIARCTLDYDLPPLLTTPQSLPAIVLIHRFRVAPAYKSTSIVYSIGPYGRQSYVQHQWWSNPGDMVSLFVARDSGYSQQYRAVYWQHANAGSTHSLDGFVEDFLELRDSKGHRTLLTVQATLMAEQLAKVQRQLLFQKRYQLWIQMEAH